MPLRLRSFLLCFVILCVAFVPVFFTTIFKEFIEPLSVHLLTGRHSFHGMELLLMGFYVSIYIGVFTGIGALAYILIRRVPWYSVRIILLSLLLSLPVFCSFSRVITSYGAFSGRGDTYTFWEVAHRYFEKSRWR